MDPSLVAHVRISRSARAGAAPTSIGHSAWFPEQDAGMSGLLDERAVLASDRSSASRRCRAVNTARNPYRHEVGIQPL